MRCEEYNTKCIPLQAGKSRERALLVLLLVRNIFIIFLEIGSDAFHALRNFHPLYYVDRRVRCV